MPFEDQSSVDLPPGSFDSPPAASQPAADDSDLLFDGWVAEEIERMTDRRNERQVLASPSPAFPAMSGFALSWLPRSNDRLVIDGAAGLGGVTDVLSDRLDARVIGIERSPATCRSARRLFPTSHYVCAGIAAWPFAPGTADAVVLAGALSRSHDPTAILTEIDRVLAPSGRAIFLDVVASGTSDHEAGRRVFRSLESIERLLPGSMEVVELAAADGWLGDWHVASEPVNRAIARRRRSHPAFEPWIEHQRQLERVVSSGAVLLAGMVVARSHADGVRPDGGSIRRLRARNRRRG